MSQCLVSESESQIVCGGKRQLSSINVQSKSESVSSAFWFKRRVCESQECESVGFWTERKCQWEHKHETTVPASQTLTANHSSQTTHWLFSREQELTGSRCSSNKTHHTTLSLSRNDCQNNNSAFTRVSRYFNRLITWTNFPSPTRNTHTIISLLFRCQVAVCEWRSQWETRNDCEEKELWLLDCCVCCTPFYCQCVYLQQQETMLLCFWVTHL